MCYYGAHYTRHISRRENVASRQVVSEPGGAAPDNYVAVRQSNTLRFVGAAVAAEHEDGRQPERHRNGRRRETGPERQAWAARLCQSAGR